MLVFYVWLDKVLAHERKVYIRKISPLVLAKTLLIHRYKSDLDMSEWPKYLWISPCCGPSLSTIQYYLYPLHPAVRPRSALMNSKCPLTWATVLLYNHRQWSARISFHRYIHLYLYMYVFSSLYCASCTCMKRNCGCLQKTGRLAGVYGMSHKCHWAKTFSNALVK